MPSPLFRNFNNNRKEEEKLAALEAAKKGGNRRGLMSSLKNKITSAVMKKLGPLGGLIEAMLRPMGKSLTPDIHREIDAAQDLMEHLNQPQPQPEPEPTPPQRPRVALVPEYDHREPPPNTPPLIEGPIEVTSSNVHSISYAHRLNGLGNGDLLVRFLGVQGKLRVGAGALYRYKDVPYRLFEAFKIAASKGKFVWDELRVRGTVSGHQFDYELAGLGDLSRVPRQAGSLRGQAGEYYIPRTFQGQRSMLPLRHVRGPRGELPGWDRRHAMRLR